MTKTTESKYNAAKTVFNGLNFDSQKEANRYAALRFLERAGHIRNLQRQVKFTLIPTQRDETGRLIEKECSYKADFVYFDCDKETTVFEDVKGFKTADYLIKRKLMLHVHGIKIKEI